MTSLLGTGKSVTFLQCVLSTFTLDSPNCRAGILGRVMEGKIDSGIE
jgi:hypothetical protein